MKIESLTIDGVKYYPVASMIVMPCEECALKEADCKCVCQGIAIFNDSRSIVIKKDYYGNENQ